MLRKQECAFCSLKFLFKTFIFIVVSLKAIKLFFTKQRYACTMYILKYEIRQMGSSRYMQNRGGLTTNERVRIDWQWPHSGVHSTMVVNSAQPGEGGLGCTPSPFNSIYHHEQSCGCSLQLRRQKYSPYFSSTLFSSVYRTNNCRCRNRPVGGGGGRKEESGGNYSLPLGLLQAKPIKQGVTKRCRLTWLTNSALVQEPKCGGGGVTGSQPMSTTVHRSPNKLWRSNSIFNLCYKRKKKLPAFSVLNQPL